MSLRARDEADVLDSQLSFHLHAGVDFFVAIDHRSQDGTTEILADISTDPTRTTITGACLLQWTGDTWKELWRGEGARVASPPGGGTSAAAQEPRVIMPGGAVKRLAWDAACSAFAGRQLLYERFFFGDPVKMASALVDNTNLKPLVERVKAFLQRTD